MSGSTWGGYRCGLPKKWFCFTVHSCDLDLMEFNTKKFGLLALEEQWNRYSFMLKQFKVKIKIDNYLC